MASQPPRKLSVRPAPSGDDRDRVVLRWVAVVDTVDYLSMLRLPRTPSGPNDADVRRAYRIFARAFHPDNYRGSPPEVRAAASKIFSVGADAYHVLSDPILRLRYMKSLAAGQPRPRLEDLERASREDARAAAQPSVSLAQTPQGRAHAERADKMIELGELSYAKSALEDACKREPENAALAAKLRAVEARLYAPRGGRRP
jgi:curved DNA-binding protein CbpA